jgi:hypothetical protein
MIIDLGSQLKYGLRMGSIVEKNTICLTYHESEIVSTKILMDVQKFTQLQKIYYFSTSNNLFVYLLQSLFCQLSLMMLSVSRFWSMGVMFTIYAAYKRISLNVWKHKAGIDLSSHGNECSYCVVFCVTCHCVVLQVEFRVLNSTAVKNWFKPWSLISGSSCGLFHITVHLKSVPLRLANLGDLAQHTWYIWVTSPRADTVRVLQHGQESCHVTILISNILQHNVYCKQDTDCYSVLQIIASIMLSCRASSRGCS